MVSIYFVSISIYLAPPSFLCFPLVNVFILLLFYTSCIVYILTLIRALYTIFPVILSIAGVKDRMAMFLVICWSLFLEAQIQMEAHEKAEER